jgi:antitoxin component YwqK of YwqJK toxin-antitoxin module
LDFTYNEAGKQTGPYTEWYENGQMKWKSNFNDKGRKTGTQTLWHNSGQKSGEWNYDDKGKLNGSLKYWDNKGHLFVHREFKDSVDINLPATYKRPSGDRLDLMRDGTFKLTYLQQSFFSRSWKTVQGKLEITSPEPEAHLKLANFGDATLLKFNSDSIVYKIFSFGTDVVFIRQK